MANIRKAIITGGAGFIGSHLAEELVRRGYQVTVFDDLSTGKKENVTKLLRNTDVKFVQGSIINISLLQEVFRDAGYIFHEAAISSVPGSIDNPFASHEGNTTGTLNVLLAARDNGAKKAIFASSSSVYGDTPVLPQREDMTPNPLSPYAVSKLAGEYYCQVFNQVYGLPTVCLRFFNVYGPRQDPDSPYAAVIPQFIKRLSEGKPPIIFGDGTQTRDFTFVKDAVEATILAAQSDASGVFNISGGKSITINQLADLITKLTGNNKIKPIHQEARPGDIVHSLADISKAKAFGYEPKYSLEEGLRETIESFEYDIRRG